jgi:malic enzyme
MFYEAARAVAAAVSPADIARGVLLPPLDGIRELSADIAARVARLAAHDGLARYEVPEDAGRWVRERMYQPVYPSYLPG